jgi:hypothetical protein
MEPSSGSDDGWKRTLEEDGWMRMRESLFVCLMDGRGDGVNKKRISIR